MENITVQELDDGGNKVKYATRCYFEVCISNDRYDELQEIAEDQDLSESEALERVIREGFDG
jgi:hypothetical protein